MPARRTLLGILVGTSLGLLLICWVVGTGLVLTDRAHADDSTTPPLPAAQGRPIIVVIPEQGVRAEIRPERIVACTMGKRTHP